MKKIIITFIICSVSFLFPLFTFAEEYEKNVLIPIDTVATVNTEKFLYQDFAYNSQIDASGNSSISFGAIHNNTISKSSISINILLFGADKKNIGFLTYCSAKDISSSYAGFKLSGNQSHDFSISVTSKYFVSGKGVKDVSYIAVMDENKYCQIGGYDNYKDLTIEEITNKDNPTQKESGFFQKFVKGLSSNIFTSKLIIIFSILIIFVSLGVLLNKLHMRMYGYKNILAYFPIADAYITAKIVFGKIVGIIYFILYAISILLFIAKIPLFAYITNFILLILIFLVIVKLATRNYNLFYLQSSMNLLGHNSINGDSEKSEKVFFDKNKEDEGSNEKDMSLLSDTQPTLDLSYDNVDNSVLLEDNSNVSSATSSGDNGSSITDLFSAPNVNSNSTNINNNVDLNQFNLFVDTDKINQLQNAPSFDSTSDMNLEDTDDTEDTEEDENSDFDDFF